MKISIYELLGLVKDGKASEITTDFMFDGDKYNLLRFLDTYALDINSLNWKIEILEEEKKIPEKINNGYIKQAIEDMKEARFNSNDMAKICNTIGWLMENRNELSNKIDEIIDYLDYLKSKGE